LAEADAFLTGFALIVVSPNSNRRETRYELPIRCNLTANLPHGLT